jgi:hypothetical protein
VGAKFVADWSRQRLRIGVRKGWSDGDFRDATLTDLGEFDIHTDP